MIDIEPLNFHRLVAVSAGVGGTMPQQPESTQSAVHINQQIGAGRIVDFPELQGLAERRPDVGRELRWVVVGAEGPGEDSLGDFGDSGGISRCCLPDADLVGGARGDVH